MKYESTILKRLIDTYGVVGNPRYISEIIKEFIVRGKECFPNLFTYQADWLAHIDEFGLNPTYTVSYTGQSIYAPNTLERPVKSAILSGKTLVNIKGEETNDFSFVGRFFNDFLLNGVKDNTKYLILYDLTITDTVKIGILKRQDNNVVWTSSTDGYITDSKGKLILHTTTDTYALRIISSENNSHVINNLTIIEYQENMENWDIPYFEGMQSVKLPVLTTTGKNLFDYKDFKRVVENGGGTSLYPINLESNTTYTFSDETGQWNGCGFFLELKDEYNNVVTQIINSNLSNRKTFRFTTNSSKQFYLYIFKNAMEKMDSRSSNFQIEKGSVATSYEPYKSNILTVNEDVTLRSNGSVCDELDLLTGKLTQRIDEDGEVLTQEVVKTVDLTILDQNGQNVKQLMSFNGGTHFNTGSLEGSPIPTLTVDVVTDLEETLKVCSLDGNTM